MFARQSFARLLSRCIPRNNVARNLLVPATHRLSLHQPVVSNLTLLQKRLESNISTEKAEKPVVAVSSGEEEEEDDILYRRIQIEARSADQAVLDSYEQFVTMTANYLGINIVRVWQPFKTMKRRTLLRSAFVKKKYRVQYEFRTYYRSIEFSHLTGSTAETFLEYIERNLPEGTALKVFRERIEEIPEHLVPPKQ